MLVSVPKINTARTRVQRSSWCSRKTFCVFNVLGRSTSPNGTKCSTKLRGTSAGEVNEFSPYSICLNLGYSVLMPCASSGHIGFTPKRKKHFASCQIIQNCNSSALFKLNYLLMCGAVHPNPGYENAATSNINSRVRRKPPTWRCPC